MEKAKARQVFHKKRMELTESEKDKMEDLILIWFQSIGIQIPNIIMTFSPIKAKNEYDPNLVMAHCRCKNPAVRFFYPVVKGREMVACAVTDDSSFVSNTWGIQEPEETAEEDPKSIPLIFMPLLAFDEQGGRVGFGKGYYDKFLATCNKKIIKVGFSFFDPIPTIDNLDEHDIPLSYCITPNGVFEF